MRITHCDSLYVIPTYFSAKINLKNVQNVEHIKLKKSTLLLGNNTSQNG